MKNWLTIAVIALVAGAGGFVFYKATRESGEAAPIASDASIADASVAAASDGAPVTTLPDISLQNRAGEKQSIRSWPGKSLIVNFWATWCAPCRKEIPLLMEIGRQEAEAGFVVVGIAIDFRDDVLKYADEIKIDYPLLIGEQDGLAAADAFGVSSAGLPFTVFTDNQERIVATFIGELTRPKADIILNAVKRVNRGELEPDAAKAAIAAELLKLPQSSH